MLELDQRCLGGLWTRSGYQRELESDCSDLLVLLSSQCDLSPLVSPPGSSPSKLSQPKSSQALQARVQPPSRVLTPADSFEKDAACPEATKDTSKDISQDPSQDILLLGTGCLWAILEEAHITTLIIDPGVQGKKLGQLLLSELLLMAQQRGLTRATLEVRASNQRALGLYQKFGFKEAGQRKRYYSDGENARILWRSGLQDADFSARIRELHQEAIAQLSTGHAVTYLTG